MQIDSNMTREVCRLFADHLHIEIPSNTDLIDSGLIDSLMLVNLLLQLEQTFGITVLMDELDLEDFRTVETIAAYVSNARLRAVS